MTLAEVTVPCSAKTCSRPESSILQGSASVIAAFFYVRVIVLMYFTEPTEETASVVIPSTFTTIALTAATVMTIALGVFPQWLLDVIEQAGVFVR